MQQAVLLLITFAFLGGVVLPIQAAVNARLGSFLDSTLWAVAVSYAVGAFVLLAIQLFRSASVPGVAGIGTQPIWIWLGGAVGVFFVVAVTITAPKLGGGAMTALVIAGQVCSSLVIDHFGLIDMPRQAISPEKVLGALLVVSGAAVVVIR